jgi:outer membrane protein TolC
MNKKWPLFLGCLISFFSVRASDTLYLRLESFLNLTLQHHPVAKIADVQLVKAQAMLLREKGGFDPYLSAGYDQKRYNGNRYYALSEQSLKIPIWPGMDAKVGFESNEGKYLNPENILPQGGLIQAGVSASLLQGLITDARRTAVQKARLGISVSENQRILILNQLLSEAAVSYLNWNQSWQEVKLFLKAYEIAKERFAGVQGQYLLGDKPAIDTLEAFIQLQSREASLNKAMLSFTNAGYILRYFMWDESATMIQWENIWIPSDTFPDISVTQKTPEALAQPEIKEYLFKQQSLIYDEKLKREMLKPSLKVNYNFFNQPYAPFAFHAEDYKWGASFQMPVLLRKERGELKWVRAQILENDWKLKAKQAEWENKRLTVKNEIDVLSRQSNLYNNIMNDNLTLLMAEQNRFAAGESSLFVVNSRDQSYILSAIQYMETRLKLGYSIVKYYELGAFWPGLAGN